jgi:hypothetical protein
MTRKATVTDDFCAYTFTAQGPKGELGIDLAGSSCTFAKLFNNSAEKDSRSS